MTNDEFTEHSKIWARAAEILSKRAKTLASKPETSPRARDHNVEAAIALNNFGIGLACVSQAYAERAAGIEPDSVVTEELQTQQ